MLCAGVLDEMAHCPEATQTVLSHNTLGLTNHPPFHLTYFHPAITVSKVQYPYIHLSMQSTSPPSTSAIIQPPTYATSNQLSFPIIRCTVSLLPLLRDDSL